MKLNTEDLGKSEILNWLFKPAGMMMGSRVRAWLFDPVKTLRGADLQSGLDAASMDTALLFGVLPWPALPLNRLLPEMYRVLKPEGRLAVWLFPVSGWVPGSILRSGLFSYVGKQNSVYNYRRSRQ